MNRRVLASLAVMTLLLSACEAQVNLRVDLTADGSGQIRAEFGVDDELKSLIESGGSSFEETFEDQGAGDLLELVDARQETYTRGELTFVAQVADFDDVDALIDLASDESQGALNDLDVSIDEDRVKVTGFLELDENELGDTAGFDPSLLEEFFGFHVQINMPGKVSTHNADRVLEDDTLEWDVPLTGGALDIQAESSLSSDGGLPLWLIIVLVAAVLALLAFVASRRPGGRPTADEEPAMAPAVSVDTEEEPATEGPPSDAEPPSQL